jgi:hypothetical protein
MTYKEAITALGLKNGVELAQKLGTTWGYIKSKSMDRNLTPKHLSIVVSLLAQMVDVKVGSMAHVAGSFFGDGFSRAGEIKEDEKGELYIELTNNNLYISNIPLNQRDKITIFNNNSYSFNQNLII